MLSSWLKCVDENALRAQELEALVAKQRARIEELERIQQNAVRVKVDDGAQEDANFIARTACSAQRRTGSELFDLRSAFIVDIDIGVTVWKGDQTGETVDGDRSIGAKYSDTWPKELLDKICVSSTLSHPLEVGGVIDEITCSQLCNVRVPSPQLQSTAHKESQGTNIDERFRVVNGETESDLSEQALPQSCALDRTRVCAATLSPPCKSVPMRDFFQPSLEDFEDDDSAEAEFTERLERKLDFHMEDIIEFVDTDGDKSVLQLENGMLYTHMYNPAGDLKFERSGYTNLVVDPKDEYGTTLHWHRLTAEIPSGQEAKIKEISALFEKQASEAIEDDIISSIAQDSANDDMSPCQSFSIPYGHDDVPRCGALGQIDKVEHTAWSQLEPATVEGRTFASWSDSLALQLGRHGVDGLGFALAQPPDEAVIGIGSYGKVWLARNRETGERYALKNIVVRRNSQHVKAIAKNEFQVAEKIMTQTHPNIIDFHWLETFKISTGNLFILAMEFCPCGDLQAVVDQCVDDSGIYTPPAETFLWFGQIFLAVEHLHRKLNLLLRDLKLGNVILSTRQCAKVTDFGFCRVEASSPGGDWTFRLPPCSPGYAAPELLYKHSYSYPADIYSLGVLAWVMLSGGLRNGSHPAPPSKGAGSDFSSYKEDWKLLQAALKFPAHCRRPLTCNVVELITSMTRLSDVDRPDVSELRQKPFFRRDVLSQIEPSESFERRDVLESSVSVGVNLETVSGEPLFPSSSTASLPDGESFSGRMAAKNSVAQQCPSTNSTFIECSDHEGHSFSF
jgi:serine/threonine protein kinase